jgi:transposase
MKKDSSKRGRTARNKKGLAARRRKGSATRIGTTARNEDVTLRSFQVGSLPLLNHLLERLDLEAMLRRHLPKDDVRQEIPTERIVLLLVRNVLISREPMYAVADWAACYSPELFDLYHVEIPLLHDDRLGRGLARLYTATTPEFILAVVRRAIDEFGVTLDELHNDSTSVMFHGDYASAAEPGTYHGRPQPAITWGHSKDHRPDLKQLLFTLTLAKDGGVPVYFSVDSGNTNDDTTHRKTWDVLYELVGGPDFLYVADCKLASRENLQHIAARGGRFVTVLPASRREDREFRKRLREQPAALVWNPCWTREDETQITADDGQPPKIVDVIRACQQEQVTSDGFRLIWFHSRRKAELDATTRGQRVQRAIKELEDLQRRLDLPRTRFRQREVVEQAVEKILVKREVTALLLVESIEIQEETFKQQGRGRPSKKTKYQRQVKSRFKLTWCVDEAGWRNAGRDDGVYPLVTNDGSLTPRELLEAYKRQPKIEKRFSQLKSDFNIAPVFLKSPPRVLGLFTVYFLALLVQSLIERELRGALSQAGAAAGATPGDESIALYPEDRRTKRPTARRIIDALEPIRRYEIHAADSNDEQPHMLFEELSETQQHLLKLFKINHKIYGR